jgi:putative SOS response-associated peptidase YedK
MEETLSIITTRANLLLERIHNTRKRMLVMLRQEDEARRLEEHLDAETSHQPTDA